QHRPGGSKRGGVCTLPARSLGGCAPTDSRGENQSRSRVAESRSVLARQNRRPARTRSVRTTAAVGGRTLSPFADESAGAPIVRAMPLHFARCTRELLAA